ncbi:MAG: hypothetical protein ACOY4W_16715 [Thermodesulfobacteriota bacterium]
MRAHIYDSSTGEIIKTVSCPADQMPMQCGSGESYIESDIGDDGTHYILAGSVVEKPANPSIIDKTSAAVDEPVTISGMAIPSFVLVNGQITMVDDGLAEFTFDTPGEYQIDVFGFPYLGSSFTVTIS